MTFCLQLAAADGSANVDACIPYRLADLSGSSSSMLKVQELCIYFTTFTKLAVVAERSSGAQYAVRLGAVHLAFNALLGESQWQHRALLTPKGRSKFALKVTADGKKFGVLHMPCS